MALHYEDEALFEYVEGTSELREEIEAHAASCADCAQEIGEHREIISLLKMDGTWDTTPEPAAEPKAQTRILEVAAFHDRLNREDAAAVQICDAILSGPSAWWVNRMRQTPNARTAGVVRQLFERMRTLLARTPNDALVVTTMAIDIADGLSVADYPSDFVVTLRAQARRDHAYVLSFIGRYPEARRVADRAEELFRQTPIPEYELARLDLVRSSIANAVERPEEAIAHANRAAATFLRFGDRRRYADARLFEGATLFQMKEYRRAYEVWLEVANEGALVGEGAQAHVASNLGICCRELGRLDEAVQHLQKAAAEYEMLGLDSYRAKTRWSLAATLMKAQRYHESIPILRATWRDLESLGMEADAALAGLELAEALLIVGETDQVPAICRALLDRFTRAGMTSPAITALAFLRETVAIGQATPAHVRHVHDFLRELPGPQALLFAPAPAGSFED